MPDNPTQGAGGVPFSRVLEDELSQIDNRRRLTQAGSPAPDGPQLPATAPPTPEAQALEKAQARGLVGLALSGGGIRSATFNLGVLQGLARLGLLRYIDYLSTVSGGGYIGGWFAAWVKREEKGLQAVEEKLGGDQQGQAEEPPEIRHLRNHSNYLAARRGILSGDTWSLVAAYLRNLLLCQLVLLPAVMGILLVPRLVMCVSFPWGGWRPPGGNHSQWFLKVAAGVAACWFLALVFLFRAVGGEHTVHWVDGRRERRERGTTWAILLFFLGATGFCLFAPYDILRALPTGPSPVEARTAAITHSVAWAWASPRSSVADSSMAAWVVASLLTRHQPLIPEQTWTTWSLELALFSCATILLVWTAYLVAVVNPWSPFSTQKAHRSGVPQVVGVAGIVWGVLLYVTYRCLYSLYMADGTLNRDYIWARGTARLVTFGPPVVLCSLVLALFIAQGLLRGLLQEKHREWWSRLCGHLLIVACGWLVLNLVGLYGTAIVMRAGFWVQAALASGWLVTVVSAVLAAGGPSTGPARPRHRYQDWLAKIGPSVFIVGLLVLVSLLIHTIIDNPPQWDKASDTVWTRSIEPKRPARRVTEVVVGPPGDPHVQFNRWNVERAEVVSDADIALQMY